MKAEPPAGPKSHVGAGEVEALEVEVAETEHQAERDLKGLESIVGGLAARLQRAKAATGKLSRGGVAEPDFGGIEGRVRTLSVPALDASRFHRMSQQARLEAARVRASAAEQLRQAIKDYAAELSRFSLQLTADEAALAQFERKLRDAARMKDQAYAPHTSPAPDGRRAETRIPMQVAIDFSTDSNFYVGFSSDISEGGVFIATTQAVPLGRRVELNFKLPGEEPLTVLGEVRWSRDPNDAAPEIFPGVGVRFLDLPHSRLQIIRKFIAAREPMFYPE